REDRIPYPGVPGGPGVPGPQVQPLSQVRIVRSLMSRSTSRLRDGASNQQAPRKEERMSDLAVIRAWKDPEFRESLTDEQRAKLPAHPSGLIEFRIQEFEEVMKHASKRCYSPCYRCGSSGP